MISLYSEPLPEAYHWSPANYVGGGPEFIVETAKALDMLGHEVVVYYDGEATLKDNVWFLPRSQYIPSEIVIAQNSRPLQMGEKNIYWTSLFHDRDENFMDFDVRVVLSKYHQGIFGKNSTIVPLACWPEDLKPMKKKFQAIYTSSPDRGGKFLEEIWPQVYKETGCPLKMSYGASGGKISGIEYLGRPNNDEMNQLYRESAYWVHPCQGIELFCIAGYKAQVAGCIPIVIPNMALIETIKYGTKTTKEDFIKDSIFTIRAIEQIPSENWKSWTDVTKELLDTLN